jgi:hypothetical protein
MRVLEYHLLLNQKIIFIFVHIGNECAPDSMSFDQCSLTCAMKVLNQQHQTLKINYVSKSKGESEKKSIVLKVDLSIQENSVCEK